MTEEADSKLEFVAAADADMAFIRNAIERERLDPERLEPRQFITLRKGGRIVAFGRIKPYEATYELGGIFVVEEERGKGFGEAVVRELARRFPQDEVYLTTDKPEYYERLGFMRTEILPAELRAKVERVTGVLRDCVAGMVYDRIYDRLPTLGDVYAARRRIAPHLPRTPLVHSTALSREMGFEAYLKLESLQPVGAFKVRGGVNLCLGMAEEERRAGIIGASTGNHGQSLAYGARLAGMRCVVAMPERANELKVESMRALGAEVEFHGENFEDARTWAEEHAAAQGLRYVHHVNAPELVAGVATMSLEVVEDLPDVDAIVTPIGGGSGAVGHCIVAKSLLPNVKVIGVQTASAPAVYKSWKERCLQEAAIETAAEGLATGRAYYAPVRVFADRMDDMLLVSEEEMREAIRLLTRSAHVVAEESGAAALAGARQIAESLRGKSVAVIVSGGNITMERLREALGE